MDNVKNDRYYVEKILTDLRFLIEHTKEKSKQEMQADDLLVDSIMFRVIQIELVWLNFSIAGGNYTALGVSG